MKSKLWYTKMKGLLVFFLLLMPMIFIGYSGSVNAAEDVLWNIRIDGTESNDGKSDFCELAEDEAATEGPGDIALDIINAPPSVPPTLDLYFANNGSTLTRDCRSGPESHPTTKTWDLVVSYDNADPFASTTVTLTWDPDDFGLTEYTYANLTTSGDPTAVLADMTSTGSYSFSTGAGTPNTFDIVLETTEDTNDPIENTPPDEPSQPTPSNGSTGVALTTVLSWESGDADGDPVTYSIWFDMVSPPQNLISENQSGDSVDPGSLEYETTYYWQVMASDDHGNNSLGSIWRFTTAAEEKDSPNNPPINPPDNPADTNQPPIAEATVSDSQVSIDQVILFNGSLSSDDSSIVSYEWDFDDGSTASGLQVNHSFDAAGEYQVQLLVTDDVGLTDTLDEPLLITVNADSQFNTPPEQLRINATSSGSANALIFFELVSVDRDDNDTLTYQIDWDDETSLETVSNISSGDQVTVSHRWDSYGVYTVTVTVYDQAGASVDQNHTIYIDVYPVGEPVNGFLVDTDGDTYFDGFLRKDDEANALSNVSYDDGKYVIDVDNDSTWDYLFDPVNNQAESITKDSGDDSMDSSDGWVGMVVVIGLLLILVLIGIIYLWKNR